MGDILSRGFGRWSVEVSNPVAEIMALAEAFGIEPEERPYAVLARGSNRLVWNDERIARELAATRVRH